MEYVVVLAVDWKSKKDPIVYYSTTPRGGCLNLSSRPAIPRRILVEVERSVMPDCEHNVEYNVVICSVNK